jgi:predicted neuraminidase
VVFDDPGLSEGNATLWVHEDGTLYVFFVTITGEGWDEAIVRLLRSSDGGTSWSAPVTLREEYCWNVRHRPVRLADGQLLLPLYQECLALPVFMRSSDDFDTWQQDPELSLFDHVGQIQPALIRVDGPGAPAGPADSTLFAITRDGTLTQRIHRTRSDDHGLTWTPSEPVGLPNSGTSVDWVRLANGHVVVVFNNDPDERFPLTVALSYDEGERFVAVRDLNAECDVDPCSYSYPSIMQSAEDGTLWVTYTHERETIGWVHFNEAWLVQGAETARIRCSATEHCVDGACLGGCSTAADCRSGETCHQSICRQPCDTGPLCLDGVCAVQSVSRCEDGA